MTALLRELEVDVCRKRPRWERAADELLQWAAPAARVLGSCTPLNLDAELASLASAYESGNFREPRFQYGGPSDDDPRLSLERAADELEAHGALAALYGARARELALEVSICRAAGSDELAPLAVRRYGARDVFDEHADALCDRWLSINVDNGQEMVLSDADDPRSLLSRMRCEVGANKLAMRVIAAARMSALAATGPGVIYVTRARPMTLQDIERTVLHEIAGHAMPRKRAAAADIGLFARGTARGSDDQEGRALAIEDHAGLLDDGRRLELARRHLAGRSVRNGASFVDSYRLLTEAGARPTDALRIAARAHRGGGLARELVYLPAYLRIADARRHDATIDNVLSAGQVALDCVDQLRPWVPAPL